MAQSLQNFVEQNEWLEVDKGEYRFSDEEMLGTEFLGSCLAIAAYDSGTGDSYLLHAPTLENDSFRADVESFLEEVKSEMNMPYEVFAGGTLDSRYNPLNNDKFAERARAEVEDMFEGHRFDYSLDWCSKPVYNRIMVSPEYGILYDEPDF